MRAVISGGCWKIAAASMKPSRSTRRALAVSRKAHPEPHVDNANLLSDLGRLALARKQYPEAEQRLRESLQIYRAILAAGPQLHSRRPDEPRSRAAGVEQGEGSGGPVLAGRADRMVESTRQGQSPVRAGAGVSGTGVGHAKARFAEAEPALLESYPVLVRARMSEHHTASVRRWIEELLSVDRSCKAGGSLLPAGGRAATRRAQPIALSSGSRGRPQSRRIRRLARHPANKSRSPGRASMRILIADDASTLPASVQDMFGRAPVGKSADKTPDVESVIVAFSGAAAAAAPATAKGMRPDADTADGCPQPEPLPALPALQPARSAGAARHDPGRDRHGAAEPRLPRCRQQVRDRGARYSTARTSARSTRSPLPATTATRACYATVTS